MAELKLNIGGVLYSTTLQTLRKYANSMLNRMFDEEWQKSTPADKPMFIDRDGIVFRDILSFLRDGPKTVLPLEREDLLKLRNESEYYLLDDLTQMINDKLNPNIQSFQPGLKVRFRKDVVDCFSYTPSSSWYMWEEVIDGRTSQIEKRVCYFCDKYESIHQNDGILKDEKRHAIFHKFLLSNIFTIISSSGEMCVIIECGARKLHVPYFALEIDSDN